MPDLAMSLVGTAVIGLPAYVIAWLFLRKQPRAIFWFALALLLVGLGYLIATGATADIGKRVMILISSSGPAKTPAAAPVPAR